MSYQVTYEMWFDEGAGTHGPYEITGRDYEMCEKIMKSRYRGTSTHGHSSVPFRTWGNQVHDWNSSSTSTSSSSSSSSYSSSSSGGDVSGAVAGAVIGGIGWAWNQSRKSYKEPGSVAAGSYRNYHYRYGMKTGDWSGYEKCVKEEREMGQAVAKWCGIGFGSLVALAFWEITLPVALLSGGGYYYFKKNQNKNRPAQVMNKYRKESIN